MPPTWLSHCGVPPHNSLGDRGNAYPVLKYTSICATSITAAISLSLAWAHLLRYRRPHEQRQILRAHLAPAVWAVISLGMVLDYEVAQYLLPIGDVYEAFYLCAIFLLFLQYAAPGGRYDQAMFETVRSCDEGDAELTVDWPRLTWLMVFQLPIITILYVGIVEITQYYGVYCPNSLNLKYANFWVIILQTITLSAAVGSIWKFYEHMKNRIRSRRGLAKLIGFKAIVGVLWLQQIVFSILIGHNLIKPSKHFSYIDLLYGLPSTIACCEMVCFALWFWYACSSTEYSSAALPGEPKLPFARAVADGWNPWDLIWGLGQLITITKHLRDTGGFRTWWKARAAKISKPATYGSGGSNEGQGLWRTWCGRQPDACNDTTQLIDMPTHSRRA